jgi:hypothetical protein
MLNGGSYFERAQKNPRDNNLLNTLPNVREKRVNIVHQSFWAPKNGTAFGGGRFIYRAMAEKPEIANCAKSKKQKKIWETAVWQQCENKENREESSLE